MNCIKLFTLALFLTLFACQGDEASDLRFGGFDEWAASVAEEQIDKSVDAYEGAVTIVPTEFEYVVLKEGDRANRSLTQTFALIAVDGQAQNNAIMRLARAQVVRDKWGNVLIQDLNQPRAWRFTVRPGESPVKTRDGVKTMEIAVSTSATSNTLPQTAEEIQALRTVFASTAKALNLPSTRTLIARSGNEGDSPGAGHERVKCDCKSADTPSNCDAGGPNSSSCSITEGSSGDSCSASCNIGYACCRYEY